MNSDLIKAVNKLIQKETPTKPQSKEELYESTQKLLSFFELLMTIDKNIKDHNN